MTLICKFGQPSHGWLPLDLIYENFHLQDEVSDWASPIDNLVSSLISALQDKAAEAFLFLEPGAYYFSFSPLGEQKIKFRVDYSSDDSRYPEIRKNIFSITGLKNEIVLPFWRAIKEHSRHSYHEHDWPECDASAIGELRALVENE